MKDSPIDTVEKSVYSEVVYLCSIINESTPDTMERFQETILTLDNRIQEYKTIHSLNQRKKKEEKELKDYYNNNR